MYNIPAFPLQIAVTVIAPYLQCFFDFSFCGGIFPENYIVNLMHKKGTKMIQTIKGPFPS